MKKIIILVLVLVLLLSCTGRAASYTYMDFSQETCSGDYLGGKTLLTTTLSEEFLEIKIKMALTGKMELFNPKVRFTQAGITVSVSSGTQDGGFNACKCEKNIKIKLKRDEIKNYDDFFFVVDQKVVGRVKIPK